jgi:hypothetical protein
VALAHPERHPDPEEGEGVGKVGRRRYTASKLCNAMARLVTDPSLEGVSGRYFEIDEEARSSEESYDREKASELWDESSALVGLGPTETPLRISAAAPEVS